MLVNTQLGDVSVVRPPSGVLAETVLLRVQEDESVEVTPVSGSSLVGDGERVLSDSLYRQMGSLLDQVRQNYPYDYQDYDPEAVILDLEFKIENGVLFFKQVRPNLRLSGGNGSRGTGNRSSR